MKRVLLIAVVCIAVIMLLFGTTFSFTAVKNRVNAVEDKTDNLQYDITSITLYAFACSDFFGGADYFNLDKVYHPDGSVSIKYESYERNEETDTYTIIRREYFPIFSEGTYPLEQQVDQAYIRLREPILCFVNWARVPYDGGWSVALGALQFVGYILGMIWGAICVVILMAVDTIGTAWQLIGVVYAILGIY